jgi:predicted negative regulator of RcsB-dependent stress response
VQDSNRNYGMWVIIGLIIIALVSIGYYNWHKQQIQNTPILIDQIVLSDIITQVQSNYYIVDLSQFETQNAKTQYLSAALEKIAEKEEIQMDNYMERLKNGEDKIDVWLAE